jgi:hypothetical protein
MGTKLTRAHFVAIPGHTYPLPKLCYAGFVGRSAHSGGRQLRIKVSGGLFGTHLFHSDMDDLSGSTGYTEVGGVPPEEDAGSEFGAYESVGEDQPEQPEQPDRQEQPAEEDDPYGEREFLSAIEQMRGGPQGQEPDPYQQPQQYQQPQGPQINQLHSMLLNPQTRQLIEQNLHQKYDAPYRMAQTQEQQQAIANQYNHELAMMNVELRAAQQAQREWQFQRQQEQFQQTMVPKMRRAMIDDLVAKHGLTPKQVAFDRATGQAITDPNLMRKQAEWLASVAVKDRVQTRRQSGVDRPYNAAAGGRGAKSVMQMSDKEFEQLERDAQRRGNRAFTGLG